ncbi:MAG TPA: hypothetical protein VLL52_17735 [Anaerolineae bacterium]|nr:hypothetical protein [Anaerolineae bacterium]
MYPARVITILTPTITADTDTFTTIGALPFTAGGQTGLLYFGR